jgi:hypothetical protein
LGWCADFCVSWGHEPNVIPILGNGTIIEKAYSRFYRDEQMALFKCGVSIIAVA